MEETKSTEEGYGRFSKEEVSLARITFKGKDHVLKLIRKVFLPSLDEKAEIGAIVDPWCASADGVDIKNLTPEDCKIYFLAREQMLKHVELQLQVLQLIANMKEETKEERETRLKADSSQ